MFIGEYRHSIDQKGRVIVPSKLRELLGSSFVLTRGLDQCLYGYHLAEWKIIEQQLRPSPLLKKDMRAVTRFLFSGAVECEFDKQGRINIPSSLVTHAKLIKDCVTIGVSNRIEIWNYQNWEEYLQSSSEAFEEFAEMLESF